MPVGAGDDRDHLRPTNVQSTNILGDHRGAFAALNIRNPQPGMRYIYENALVRGGGKVLNRLNQGYTLIQEGDPEQWGGQLPPGVQAQTGSFRAFQDVVPMRIPIALYNEIQKEKKRLADAASDNAEEDFKERGENLRRKLGPMKSDGDLYYARADHRTTEE